MLKLAGVYETDRAHPTGDWDSFAANAELRFNPDWTFRTAFVDKKHDVESLDRSGMILGLDRNFGTNVKVFLETGQYDGAPDNIAFGISVTI